MNEHGLSANKALLIVRDILLEVASVRLCQVTIAELLSDRVRADDADGIWRIVAVALSSYPAVQSFDSFDYSMQLRTG